MVAGNVDEVATERLKLQETRKPQGYRRLGTYVNVRVVKINFSHRGERARIRGRIQQNVVSGVHQHLKHLRK